MGAIAKNLQNVEYEQLNKNVLFSRAFRSRDALNGWSFSVRIRVCRPHSLTIIIETVGAVRGFKIERLRRSKFELFKRMLEEMPEAIDSRRSLELAILSQR